MRNIKIALIDDNREFIQDFRQMLEQSFQGEGVQCDIQIYHDALSFKCAAAELPAYDICFLDIEMPGMSGMELAKSMRESNGQEIIVFLTAYSEFIRAGYEVKAFDYLIKDKAADEIGGLVKRLINELDVVAKKVYIIETHSRLEKINHSEIIYIYKRGPYSRFVLSDREIQERKALKDVLDKLNSTEFILVERGYVINLNHIKRVCSRNVELSDGTNIPVGRAHINELKERIQEYWMENF
ncbi:MAG: LytTR family DNA-binding domain-containing protein [Lachnospiraceae bacterium]|nr:LytTR family DNA-binding domain-containing protein [Lachnospiraceae bacterium]